MKKTTINGKRYIAIGDLDFLLYSLRQDVLDNYPVDAETGKPQLDEGAEREIKAYSAVMAAVMGEELDMAETEDDIRQLRKSVSDEYFRDKYCIVGEEDGKPIYFRKYCDAIPADDGSEGDDTPVFTSLKRQAKVWEDHYYASAALNRLKKETGMDDLRVMPLYLVYATKADLERLKNAIFGDLEEADGDGKAGQPEAAD